MKTKILLAMLMALLVALPALAAERTEIDISGRPQLGPADAPVTIVEFLDFQ
jgi:hypothetical protein